MEGWWKKRELGGRDIPRLHLGLRGADFWVYNWETIVKASSLLNLFVDLMNLIVDCKIRLLVTLLKLSLPYRRILFLYSLGRTEKLFIRILEMLLSRILRWSEKRGQRVRKCLVHSSSRAHLHIGDKQLNLWSNRCRRRSLKSTLSLNSKRTPYLSSIPKKPLGGGRITFR